MLWALLDDFRAWGQVHTMTTLDTRLDNFFAGLSPMTLPADEVVYISPGQYEAVFSSLLARSDAALIVAPETEGILTGSVLWWDRPIPLLGSPAAATPAIRRPATSVFARLDCQRHCFGLTFATVFQVADEIGCPLVTKPLDGGLRRVCL
jgi:predicted ATP-grasp superfamily ATP-dependent carboligase